jgi:hypothetical protein
MYVCTVHHLGAQWKVVLSPPPAPAPYPVSWLNPQLDDHKMSNSVKVSGRQDRVNIPRLVHGRFSRSI